MLFEGWDPDVPDVRFWFTAGGEIEPGETPLTAAVREVLEETGLDVDGRLRGPFGYRCASFEFLGVRYEQTEEYYACRLDVDGDDVTLDRAGWSDVERASMGRARWWTPEQVAAAPADGVTVYPEDLLAIVARAAAG